MMHLTIKHRLLLLALLAVVAVSTLSGLFYSSNSVNQRALSAVFQEDGHTLVRLQRMENLLLEVRFRAAGVLLEQLPLPGSMNHLKAARKELSSLQKEFEPISVLMFHEGEALASLKQLNEQWQVVDGTLAKLEQAYAAKDNKAITAVLEDEWPLMVKAVVKPMQTLIPLAQKRSEATYEAALASGDRRLATGMVVALVCLALLVVSAIVALRSVLTPLAEVKRSLRAISSGNLGSELPAPRSDELGSMVETLGVMQNELSSLVRQLRDAAHNIETASAEVASGNADLSSRTEQAALNLQSTAASTEQLAGAVAHSADSAREASRLASAAAEVAERGGAAVNAVMLTMDGIADSSKRIADIIGVIDGIAFQTNILALNAAVEAARAGDQGRGFAVVASEVRSLAGRSASAAKEIKALIEASVACVDAGSNQVRQAVTTLSEIVAAVNQVTTTIDEVSLSTTEQSQGITRINEAVSELEAVTQQNAALVEESSAAAYSLQEQATRLTGLADTFQLDGAEAVARQRTRPAPALPAS